MTANTPSAALALTMAITEHPYLEYDEAKALAVKCIWALGALGSAEAVEKLKLLARSNNFIISSLPSRRIGRRPCVDTIPWATHAIEHSLSAASATTPQRSVICLSVG